MAFETGGTRNSWSDAEKIALLISVIKASGSKPKWSEVAVPTGRTSQTSVKMYSELMKAAAGVAMTEGADITPSKKRGRKNGDGGAAKVPADEKEKKTRGRKPKVEARVATPPSSREDDEGESPSKKVKVESVEEDEGGDGIHGDFDSQV